MDFTVSTHTHRLTTPGAPAFVDLTDEVAKALDASGIKQGTVTVFSKHTTAAIRINERESGIHADVPEVLERLVPAHAYYRHNDGKLRTENLDCEDDRCDKNGHSHVQQFLMGTSETIPVVDGKLTLGRWQRIFLVELCSSRKREVIFQFVGTT